MTSPATNSSDLDAIISATRYLLLDFDGPICSVFAGLPAHIIASRLRKLLGDHTQLPAGIARTPDPIEVFTYAATISTDLAARVEAEMTGQELAAVATAAPTPYVHDVVTASQNSDARSPSSATTQPAPSTPTWPATAWTTGSTSWSQEPATTPPCSSPART